MNLVMLKTELYKLFSRKVAWVAMALFLLLFLAVKLQFIAKPGVVYTLEPVRGPLTRLVGEDSFREFIRSRDYNASREELRPLLPTEVTEYIEGYQNDDLANRSLNTDLVRVLNNFFNAWITVRNTSANWSGMLLPVEILLWTRQRKSCWQNTGKTRLPSG